MPGTKKNDNLTTKLHTITTTNQHQIHQPTPITQPSHNHTPKPQAIRVLPACGQTGKNLPVMQNGKASRSTETLSTKSLGGLLTPISRHYLPSDLLDWIQLCESGGLYSAIAQLYGLSPEPSNKGKVKKIFFAVAYGSTPKPAKAGSSGYRRWQRWQRFEQRWPTLARYLRRMKAWSPALTRARRRGYPQEFLEHWARGRPARLSQRVDAWLVIYVASMRLRLEYPGAPIVTCHDSILTTSPYIPMATQAIKDAFGELGLNPVIH